MKSSKRYYKYSKIFNLHYIYTFQILRYGYIFSSFWAIRYIGSTISTLYSHSALYLALLLASRPSLLKMNQNSGTSGRI